ncbi:bifunctional D-glycero-beta-D-manno-heptose-7-phosphate kinase/D-glycero-beta-D-manno-heptose 1-phosphate adenylyltransferase HldE [Francisella frigiditurris]|uniref:Bifunctional protein HldE n=1 Tax=Francisella frigiditurris TaxID=1542390 RepID=A0A1J0KWJ2_9GAMM|nr:bifunctional D-glycero-beta-D-manno-heptose-7-phosphate kinase/D-glycero-beta-D-manno-heptose 1-phosphate adenylyltransferase HldE [Francisella frigiditurris]APC97974.1 bifunctional protein RfaE, domain I [Francisella frigiditurris]
MYKDISKAKILVVGDVMLDKYYHGSSDRISPEAPVPVVNVKNVEDRVGGAGNVALNISSLDGVVGICALVGKDESANILEKELLKRKVQTSLIKTEYPTITKLRVLAQKHQLVRLDFEQNFNDIAKNEFIDEFQKILPNFNTVILSDYGKGTLSNTPLLIEKAKAAGCQVLVDPKGTDFSKYSGATVITPNLKEFEAVVGKCQSDDDIVKKATELANKYNIDNILITRSEKGMTIVKKSGDNKTIPTVAKEVFDVTGAGDTVIAVLSIGISLGYTVEESMKIANAAAGVVVGKVGTATVTLEELHAALAGKRGFKFGVVSQDELAQMTNDLSLVGEKVVMTNGCFDILHAGHVEYLQAARKLGDKLIVAVNTDESVARLKGPERPIVPLQARMELLAALGCVDWVVPFSEDTPVNVIEKVTPNILVKGADYTVDNIVGAEHVISNGGEVKTITLKPGFSTTNIVNKIKSSN